MGMKEDLHYIERLSVHETIIPNHEDYLRLLFSEIESERIVGRSGIMVTAPLVFPESVVHIKVPEKSAQARLDPIFSQPEDSSGSDSGLEVDCHPDYQAVEDFKSSVEVALQSYENGTDQGEIDVAVSKYEIAFEQITEGIETLEELCLDLQKHKLEKFL